MRMNSIVVTELVFLIVLYAMGSQIVRAGRTRKIAIQRSVWINACVDPAKNADQLRQGAEYASARRERPSFRIILALVTLAYLVIEDKG